MFFAVIWFWQSIITMIYTGTPFAVIHLWIAGLTMHTSTSLNLTAIYIVSYLFYRTFFFGHERVVRALLFTSLGVLFYDTIWSICNYTINSTGSFIIPLTSTIIVISYLIILNKQKKILDLNWKRIIPITILYIISLYIFITSGFFQQMELYNQFGGTDPNSWIWLFNKTISLWMWLAIALR